MRILISACLLGVSCRYDGASKPIDSDKIERLKEKFELIPICPESLGGLHCPRDPAERIGKKVISCNGADVTAQYERGARESLYLAELFGCKIALLKERSPSCGKGQIYDGTFSGKLRDGNGVTAELLTANGIAVYGESQIDELLGGSE